MTLTPPSVAPNPTKAPNSPPQTPLPSLRSLPSEAVLQGQPSVAIEHNGQTYRLQTTRQGKLILTK